MQRWLALALVLLVTACGNDAEDQAQLVVFVDTDAASVAELGAERSPAAAIDVVRIEGLAVDGSVFDGVEVVVTDPGDFPLSFGILPTKARVRLRIRAFSTATAVRSVENGAISYEPSPRLALERVVDLDIPESRKAGALVFLSAECFGHPSTFEPAATCIDGAPNEPFDAGVVTVDPDAPPVTRVGTSPRTFLSECPATGDDERICIPGGLSVLGSDDLTDLGVDPDAIGTDPARLVELSSFAIDRHELSVGRFRALVNGGLFDGELPTPETPGTIDANCTWRGADDASRDTLPLTCITVPTAERVCELMGGRLPTEAEWERAARGPGNANRYPWGNHAPKCCTASFGRAGSAACGEGPIEPVGSHAPSEACGGSGDRTAEGVEDLGGSMHELTRDGLVGYDAPCWSVPGILKNPVCDPDSDAKRIVRGGSWDDEGIRTLSALRFVRSAVGSGMDNVGVRCVYPL
jgi:formylglycine-generating enzyme required for sulfatase activity